MIDQLWLHKEVEALLNVMNLDGSIRPLQRIEVGGAAAPQHKRWLISITTVGDKSVPICRWTPALGGKTNDLTINTGKLERLFSLGPEVAADK
ncbi:hypothetical protein [Mariprofundus aestuarium]|uniref:hypothetical protein n=1 Tax=Mariprofundus aestuarium TaxID=1921086 RepID=UPI0018E21E8D|nr:hypothetical protein [Mariprofundus aestuarium]